VGSREEEGNTFLRILRRNPDIKCFILNTGKVGGTDRGQKITVLDSVKILEMLARDKISWRRDEFWGYEVPVKIPGVELGRFDLGNFYSKEQIQELSEDLKQERLEWLAQFPGLDKDITSAIKP
jgi:phosphoenolpyruvate carboxykinase (ATP)